MPTCSNILLLLEKEQSQTPLLMAHPCELRMEMSHLYLEAFQYLFPRWRMSYMYLVASQYLLSMAKSVHPSPAVRSRSPILIVWSS